MVVGALKGTQRLVKMLQSHDKLNQVEQDILYYRLSIINLSLNSLFNLLGHREFQICPCEQGVLYAVRDVVIEKLWLLYDLVIQIKNINQRFQY